MSGRVLVVDDDDGMCAILHAGLGKSGMDVQVAASADAAMEHMRLQDVDCVLTDINMRGMNGLELCERIVRNRPDVPVLVMTAFGSMDCAIAAIRAGAYDLIPKPFDLGVVRQALARALDHKALRQEVKALRSAAAAQENRELLGNSRPMKIIHDLLDRIRDSDASVLVEGESGTGKELVANALHRLSRRKDGPFVAVNCAAMPETLLESELFGHARGAFTDARTAREGLFVQANGGTVFLDEIGELPLALQPKLLRALQEKRVRPIGGAEVPFDARVVTATNRDLESEVEARRFREDLFYRINVLRVLLPPLRLRGNDVLMLAQHFLQRFADDAGRAISGISEGAARALLGYTWPGNVRELSNCMERAVALARLNRITEDDLPEQVRQALAAPVTSNDDPRNLGSLEEMERLHILRVLKAVGGNKSAAAHVLGIERKTLYRKLEKYGVVTADRP